MCPDVICGSRLSMKLIFLKHKHVFPSQRAGHFKVVLDGYTDKSTQLKSPLKCESWIADHNMYQKNNWCAGTPYFICKNTVL